MRVFGWLSKLLIIVCIVCGLTVFTTWQIVSLYVNKLLAPLNLEQEQLQIQFAELLTFMYSSTGAEQRKLNEHGGLNGGSLNEHSGNGTLPLAERGEDDSSNQGNNDKALADGSNNDEAARQEQEIDDALPVWSNQSSSHQQLQEQNQVMITMEQLSQTKENLSSGDKLKIFALVFQKLPQNEIQRISKLMENGLTAEELAEIEAIIEVHLSEQEMNELFAILQKY